MTTLTTRPLPLLPLAIARSMTCNERSPSAGSPTPSPTIMHPDNLLLQGHGVTSPRLSSGSSIFCENLVKNCTGDSSPHSVVSSAPGDSGFGRYGQVRSPEDGGIEATRSEFSDNGQLEDLGTDQMSCCSEDSELSVGQEGCASNGSGDPTGKGFSASGGKRGVVDDSESVDNASNLSDEARLGLGGGDQAISDDMSNDSSPNRDVDPTLITPAMRIPVPVVRPSPTRLQEEFLRKSHLYAEELMKQQMQFMAAARASAFSLRHAAVSPEMGKVGFRPHVKSSTMQPEMGESLVNFSGIHSHLSAISKISQLTNGTESALNKLTAFGVMSAREMTQSPPFANQLNLNHPGHSRHPFMNNNLNETSLKFSIDNILKADFGRRITDPLLKRNSSNGGGGLGGKGLNPRKSRSCEKHESTPVDLTSLVTGSAGSSSIADPVFDKHQTKTGASSQTPAACSVPSAIPPPSAASTSSSSSSSAAAPAATPVTATSSESTSSSTGSSSSSSGSSTGTLNVWPAWVYCTRFSDRPSSGPRTRKPKKPPSEKGGSSSDEKRPRTAFSGPQLARLKHEFSENRYLTERRRQQLSAELGLNEAQIKIWFQNKRAKIKKANGTKTPLALQLMAQGLYNHSTVPLTREEEELQELQAKNST